MTNLKYPDGFTWGVATASYQIEGGAEDRQLKSIWDTFTSDQPSPILDASNGDVACDSYNNIDRDIAMLKHLGVESYRFSISWPRLMTIPEQGANVVFDSDPKSPNYSFQPKGLAYYNALLDAMVREGIQPCVTLFHWDLPQVLQDIGGWLNPRTVELFGVYAEACFWAFGDRVDRWITLNEPFIFLTCGHVMGQHAPGFRWDEKNHQKEPFLLHHGLMKGHLSAAHKFRGWQTKNPSRKAEIGISLSCNGGLAHDPEKKADVEAQALSMKWQIDWFLDILIAGRYSDWTSSLDNCPDMRDLFGRDFGCGGHLDFLGINIYTSYTVERTDNPEDYMFLRNLRGYRISHRPEWKRAGSEWLFVTPEAIRNVVCYADRAIRRLNNEKPLKGGIFITENGLSDPESVPAPYLSSHEPSIQNGFWSDQEACLDDQPRIDYLQGYLSQLHAAITQDGADVRGYYCWSLMDNFEWNRGYIERFGLFSVYRDEREDGKSVVQVRPKRSTELFRKVCAENALNL